MNSVVEEEPRAKPVIQHLTAKPVIQHLTAEPALQHVTAKPALQHVRTEPDPLANILTGWYYSLINIKILTCTLLFNF